ncbi:MAG TPA: hypothetical protein ENN64_00565 [bacterium]|nr:hypothetical protein [bacterium]
MKDNAKPKAYISVTGYHKEDITSDKGLFYITFKRTGGSAEESINSVREDEKKILKHIEQYSESTDIEIEKQLTTHTNVISTTQMEELQIKSEIT